MSIIVKMRQDLVDNFVAFGIDHKQSIESMVDSTGNNGQVIVYDKNEEFYKSIAGEKTFQIKPNGSIFIKNKRLNKYFGSCRDIMGFFDATEYVIMQGDLDYLTNLLRYGGVVKIDNEYFAGLLHDNIMRDAALKMIKKQII